LRHGLTQRSPLRLAAYLTVQLLACCAAFHGLSVAEVLLRWRRGPNAAPRLTAALHSAAPLLWALSAYVSLAFYLLIYPDPVFQATVVAKARSADARTHARTHARFLVLLVPVVCRADLLT
jgi:hypothetical protein